MLHALRSTFGCVCFGLVLADAFSSSAQNLETTHLLAGSSCPSRTINYITHTLPQQCLRTDWSRNATVTETSTASATSDGSSPPSDTTTAAGNSTAAEQSDTGTTAALTTSVASPSSTEASAKISPPVEEQDDDPLSDEAQFVSFEEWKAQMLKKAGQSPEHMINTHETAAQEGRRRPAAINQALDSLGDDVEIDIDFGGFANAEAVAPPVPTFQSNEKQTVVDNSESTPVPPKRSRDAGKTSRERFNYASFDCAATVLKTNAECKGSTWILHEHKDSYMLNPCSVKNKFFIVELCNDILIDTIALGNYEFFSSTFRQFRVSISDRYPVKSDKWRELGIFEAQNTRGVQAFLVENGLIWGRYLRIEILSHYGAEYYCPVSVLRVHGKTMIDDYRNDMKAARGEDDGDDEAEAEGDSDTAAVAVKEDPVVPAVQSSLHVEDPSAEESSQNGAQVQMASATQNANATIGKSSFPLNCRGPGSFNDKCPRTNYLSPLVEQAHLMSSGCKAGSPFCNMELTEKIPVFARLPNHLKSHPTPAPLPVFQDFDPPRIAATAATTATMHPTSTVQTTAASISNLSETGEPRRPSDGHGSITSSTPTVTTATTIPRANPPSGSATPVATTEAPKADRANSSSATSVAVVSNGTVNTSTAPTKASTAPPAASPPTQESFFKSVHKRLQFLESNSTLSLQYIEEQSRLLREAFTKVEKRQLNKTSTFLSNLNETVMSELRELRLQYDQIWQSTILELSSQREQSFKEAAGLSARLAILADEVVWQKRIVYLQFGLILLGLGMFMFSRSPPSGLNQSYIDLPPFRDIWTRSPRPSLRRGRLRSGTESSVRHGLETPVSSPSRPSSGHGITWAKLKTSDDESDGEVKSADLIADYQPPTPPLELEHHRTASTTLVEVDRMDSPVPELALRRAVSSPALGIEATDSDEEAVEDPIVNPSNMIGEVREEARDSSALTNPTAVI